MDIFRATYDLTWRDILKKGYETLKLELQNGDENYEN